MPGKKINIDRVIPRFADEALRLAKGEMKKTLLLKTKWTKKLTYRFEGVRCS